LGSSIPNASWQRKLRHVRSSSDAPVYLSQRVGRSWGQEVASSGGRPGPIQDSGSAKTSGTSPSPSVGKKNYVIALRAHDARRCARRQALHDLDGHHGWPGAYSTSGLRGITPSRRPRAQLANRMVGILQALEEPRGLFTTTKAWSLARHPTAVEHPRAWDVCSAANGWRSVSSRAWSVARRRRAGVLRMRWAACRRRHCSCAARDVQELVGNNGLESRRCG